MRVGVWWLSCVIVVRTAYVIPVVIYRCVTPPPTANLVPSSAAPAAT